MIHNPRLPPQNGYVEDEDENGNRFYKPTPETSEKEELYRKIDELTEALQMIADSL